MFSTTIIDEIAADIQTTGRSIVHDESGKRLLIVLSSQLDIPGEEMILAYEGRGAIFFTGDRPLNHYRLMAHGFPEPAAHSIADMINRLIPRFADVRRIEATTLALAKEEETNV